MTWLPKQRRWRKRYKGQQAYFPLLPSETGKLDSYQRCWAACQRWMHGIDAEVIKQEEEAKQRHAKPLRDYLEEVRAGFPDGDNRRIVEHFISAMIRDAEGLPGHYVDEHLRKSRQLTKLLLLADHAEHPSEMFFFPAGDQPSTVPVIDSEPSSDLVEAFSAYKSHKGNSVSPRRLATLKSQLRRFEEHCAGLSIEAACDGQNLLAYRQRLVESDLAPQTQKVTLTAAIGFIKWLYEIERIDQMPRVVGSRALTISAGQEGPRVADEDTIRGLLTLDGPCKAFVLLGLNCGMTRADFRVLKRPDGQYLEHRRPKTKHHSSTPTVTYKLWPETLEALPHLDGISFEITSAVSRRLNLACKKKGLVPCEQKMLRKASATVLRNSEHAGLVDHWLGHAASSIADRHYAAVQQASMDAACDFLREQWITRRRS